MNSQNDYVMPTEGGSYSLAPAGSYQAVCCEVLRYEPRIAEYKDQKTGETNQRTVSEIQYVFQLNKIDPETGKRYEVRSKKLNKLFSEKAALREFMKMWRGHDITDEEKHPPGVNINLVGRNAMVQVIHVQSGDKTYANIGSIMPLFEGMPAIAADAYQPKQEFIDKQQAAATAPAPQFSGQPQHYPAPNVMPPAPVPAVPNDMPF